jgi:hypothetical protein
MLNSKFWNPEKNYFALLLPLKAHNSNKGIMGKNLVNEYQDMFQSLTIFAAHK